MSLYIYIYIYVIYIIIYMSLYKCKEQQKDISVWNGQRSTECESEDSEVDKMSKLLLGHWRLWSLRMNKSFEKRKPANTDLSPRIFISCIETAERHKNHGIPWATQETDGKTEPGKGCPLAGSRSVSTLKKRSNVESRKISSTFCIYLGPLRKTPMLRCGGSMLTQRQ